jgi:hypothetical protein
MAVSLAQLKAHVRALGWHHEVRPDHDQIALGMPMRLYVDDEGEKHAGLFIDRVLNGEYVVVLMPRAYSLKDCRHKAAVLNVLMQISYLSRSLQCGYDPEDDEVRLRVDTWVLDNTLTELQLDVMVRILLKLVDEYDPVVRHAMQTGRIDFSLAQPEESAPPKTAELPPEIAALLEKAGGMEGLREVVERSQVPKKKSAAKREKKSAAKGKMKKGGKGDAKK